MYVCVVLKRKESFCANSFFAHLWVVCLVAKNTNPTTFFENSVSESDRRRQAYKSIIKDWEVNLESEKSGVSGAQCAMEAAGWVNEGKCVIRKGE